MAAPPSDAAALQALTIAGLPPAACGGFTQDDSAYRDALVPQAPLHLEEAFMTDQLPDIDIGSEMHSVALAEAAFAPSSFPPSAPLPQPTTFPAPNVPSPPSSVQPSPYPAIDYPPILASSPTLPSTTPSTTSPSLQQTTFTYPTLTPPPSNSSSPQPLLSTPGQYHAAPSMLSPHTPAQTAFPPLCQDPGSAQALLGQGVANGNGGSPGDQSSHVFTYPSPDPVATQPLPNQNQAAVAPNPASFFPTVPAPMAHHTLHLPNLNQAQAPPLAPAFPPSSFSLPSSSLPHPPFQAASAAQSLPPQALNSASCSYPSVDLGAMPQFNPSAPFLSEMVLHPPPRLPQLDPPLPACLPPSTAGPALYPPFPTYPLRLCQDPRSSLPIPLRHLYRQHQHGHAHSQGPYLDMSNRGVY